MASLRRLIPLLAAFWAIVSNSSALSECQLKESPQRRLFLLSDIANEPDDAQSLVRLLVYANEFQIDGLVATTSWWLNDSTRPDQMRDIVGGYAECVENLRKHASGWPEPDYLLNLVKSGSTKYGMNGVGENQNSEGSDLLVTAVDRSEEPLWIPVWGGANTLAQALWYVNATRSAEETEKFVAKLRVYSISDQDNSGPWIRRNWPNLFYIASVHDFNRYANAAWGGISGDDYYHFPSGGNKEVISKSWIKNHIQSVGPLGARYPDTEFIIEGDSPSLLYLIPRGLSDPEHPEWGSWGGRYGPVAWGEGHFADSIDTIVSDSGSIMMGPHVTIWRWRNAFQNDFKARMQWTIKSKFEGANHSPIAVVNGSSSRDILEYTVMPGEKIILDATASCDQDGDDLSFKWWQYLEPSSNLNTPKRDVLVLKMDATDTSRLSVEIPNAEAVRQPGRGVHPSDDKHLHIILEVSDGDIVAYRRIILTIKGNIALEKRDSGHDEL
ncbi:DUF1593-domain-containing protein [Penicillium cosmopolitanum]|uniref:DUF1593-domain-containing protein n=1 Tax=Penicillium cosmopolitanum TaxID=1131564 RepID=A0A9W9WC93_9EURO|nr:DUF1593-domain-containing protein [Penicillium cosmopolitanum]KAJ5414761.1 DUF1593-domain-containing protein [Penicillium cosmopolitanum]